MGRRDVDRLHLGIGEQRFVAPVSAGDAELSRERGSALGRTARHCGQLSAL